jgi:hypothetical protein
MARSAARADAHGGAVVVTRALLGILVAAGTALGAEAPAEPLGACGPVARRHEHVELRTLDLRKLARTPLERVGVVAARDGAVVPIPFQVDEREGRRIAMTDGSEPSGDSKPGRLDPDDVLVFLPCDAGTRLDAGALARAVPGLETWREVRLDDPIDGGLAFAYVVVAPAPPVAARRYVGYAPDAVTTAAYRIAMVQALPEAFALSPGGRPGPNLLDGLRLRAEATLLGGLGTVTLTERDARHALIAWRAGPVRVVRRSRHDVDLLGVGIHVSAGVANTAFYPLHVSGPGSLKLPISPGLLFREIRAMGGVDLRDLRGWRFVAPGAPADGFPIDGTMEVAERTYGADATWFVLARDRQALLVTITLSDNLARAIPFGVVYLDDATQVAPPERERGSVPLVGFRGRGIERLPADRYAFDLRVFVLPDYRDGDAARVLAERSRPLVPTVTGPPPPAAAPASSR